MKDIIKNQNVSTLSEYDLIRLCEQAFTDIDEERWSAARNHVKDIENNYWSKDGAIETVMEQIIIEVENDTNDSWSDSNSETE